MLGRLRNEAVIGFWRRQFSSGQEVERAVTDVAIVGAGMVGAALAALLAKNPLTASLRVVVLDQKEHPLTWNPPPVPELRVSTLTPASIRCLRMAGAWEGVQSHAAPFSKMQVWDKGADTCIRWHASDAGMDSMGVVAENSLVQAAFLGAAASSRPGVDRLNQQTGNDTGYSDFGAGSSTAGVHPQAGGLGQGPTGGSQTAAAGSSQHGRRQQGGVQFMWPVQLRSLQLPPARSAASSSSGGGAAQGAGNELARLELKDGRALHARLVVAADGAASHVRRLAGLRTFGWQYGQRGVVATVRLEGAGGCQGTAWQRFLPTGPLALLPIRDGLASVVWSAPSDVAQDLEKLGPEEFAAAINKALHDPFPSAGSSSSGSLGASLMYPLSMLLSGASLTSAALASPSDRYQPPPRVEAWVGTSPKSFPLQMQHSGMYVRPRLALIGDAAHAVHPLAGQGVNLGLGDAVTLAEALAHAQECGRDPGELLLLRDHYESPRRRANFMMSAALDGLYRVFGVQAPPVSAARGLGLSLLNASGPVKTSIMKYAMGL